MKKLFLLFGLSAGCLILKKATDFSIFYFLFLGLSALLLYSLGFKLLGKFELSEKKSKLIVSSVCLLYLILFSTLSILKFNAFTTEMTDFGNMDQGIWNTSEGRLLHSTQLHSPYPTLSRLSFHVEFFYVILSGLFFLYSKAQILFVAQTVFLAVSIYLVYLLAKEILRDEKKAVICALIFSLFPSLQFMNLYDLHGDVFSIPFLLMGYLLYLKRRYIGFYLCLLFALSCKEYVSLTLLGFGISLFLFHKDKKNGIAVFLLGFTYFIFAMYYIIPHFNQGRESALIGGAYGDIGGAGGLKGILIYALTNPIDFVVNLIHKKNLENTFYLFFPIFFICFRSPIFLLGACPILLKDWMYGMSIYNHHIATGLPYIFISFIYGIKNQEFQLFGKTLWGPLKTQNLIVLPICATLISVYFFGPSPLGHRFWREINVYIPTERDKLLQRYVEKIPEEVVASVSGHLAPHLTHRHVLYVFPRPYHYEEVEYILLDTVNRPDRSWDHPWDVKEWMGKLDTLGFDLLEKEDGIFMYKKSAGN